MTEKPTRNPLSTARFSSPSATNAGHADPTSDVVAALHGHMRRTSLRQRLADFSAFDHDELLARAESLAMRLDALIEATQKTHANLPLELLLTRLVTLISTAFDADRASLFLYDRDTHELYSRCAQGEANNEIRINAELGIAGAVFTSGLPALVHDAPADPRFNPTIDSRTGYRTRNILCIPVRNRRGIIIGVTEVLNKHQGSFDASDLALLQVFGTQMSSAIENAQLSERALIATREESRIIEVTRAISSELNIDKLLRRIMATATELLDAERSTLFLHDQETNELWSRVAEGLNEKEIRFPSNVGVAGQVFTHNTVINIADAYADPRFNPEIDHRTGFLTRTILGVPVVDKHGLVVGVVQVLNRRGRGPFTTRDERRLEMLAAHSAIALENARLFHEISAERNYSESVLSGLNNGVITLDLNRNIVKVNPAATALLGLSSELVLGASTTQVFDAENIWIHEATERVAQTQTANYTADAKFINPQGVNYFVNLTVAPLRNGDDTALGFTLVFDDITEQKRLRSTMARYMTTEIAEQVLAQGDAVLGGRGQTATVLFADIVNFTALSEQLGPQATVTLLNDYFTTMVEVIFAHEGTLDKYIGDAIMAVFGTPFPSPDDPDRAISVAIKMRRALRELNERLQQRGLLTFEIRIGIYSDHVVVGNVGSQRRMDYTVIGDGVNLAARLESANKYYGTHVLAGGETVTQLVGTYRLRELDLLRVRGKTAPVAVYEVLGFAEEPLALTMENTLRHFRAGYRHYQQRSWTDAMHHFEAALVCSPLDTPSRILLERSRHYAQSPPATDWDGAWTLTEQYASPD